MPIRTNPDLSREKSWTVFHKSVTDFRQTFDEFCFGRLTFFVLLDAMWMEEKRNEWMIHLPKRLYSQRRRASVQHVMYKVLHCCLNPSNWFNYRVPKVKVERSQQPTASRRVFSSLGIFSLGVMSPTVSVIIEKNDMFESLFHRFAYHALRQDRVLNTS